jgi:hypothetical protein
MSTTDDERIMFCMLDRENADSSIRDNRESDANEFD